MQVTDTGSTYQENHPKLKERQRYEPGKRRPYIEKDEEKTDESTTNTDDDKQT